MFENRNRSPRSTSMAGASIFIIALIGYLGVPLGKARPQTASKQASDRGDAEVHVLPVRGNVYMLTGAGGNVTLQTGQDGVLLVDTGRPGMSDQVVAAIRTISKAPIRFIINTQFDPDHTGGNAAIDKLGSTILDDNFGSDLPGSGVVPGAKLIVHVKLLDRLIAPGGDAKAAPADGRLVDTYDGKEKKLFINGEAVILYHRPSNTDGSSIVFFRRSDVISTGDVFNTQAYPVIDEQKGGSIQGVIAALNFIIELTVPEDKQEGGTYIIPGHGRLCDQADLVEYQTMVTVIRDRVQDMIQRGMSLEQVKAARPTFDYDNHYGRTTGPWTAERFIEAVYRGLSQN